jgi:aspartyl-tRNA(Asn)/glutamyl-tRNA(Gln) amidotransferase subunit B
MNYKPVIGLEVHAELQTKSKMFCACAVVDNTVAAPNSAVCPVCAGMPGTLPVVNQKALEFGIRVALALECTVNPVSVFARKNYFYPDLPKGYQISQYEQPLAENGRLVIQTSAGERTIRIRRVHLEEDTGKLTHMVGATLPDRSDSSTTSADCPYSLLDLNRAGVPLLEIVSEPDIRSAEEAVAYGESLRHILRYLEVNSGDMEKGVIRFEANISVRPAGVEELGTRTEVKNLNSFRALERSIIFEIERQSKVLSEGGTVEQETLGWNETQEVTYSQRSKEDAHDYRYFPEPDLPPLKVDEAWLTRVRAKLPELPRAKFQRFVSQYSLSDYDATRLVEERVTADYFESTVHGLPSTVPPKVAANWLLGEVFGLMKARGESLNPFKASAEQSRSIPPEALAELVRLVADGEINQTTGRTVLAEMFESGRGAAEIVATQVLSLKSSARRWRRTWAR